MADAHSKSNSSMTCLRCGINFPCSTHPKKRAKRKYCSTKCSLAAIHDGLRIPLADRFWKHVSKGSDDQCWPFTRRFDKKGYGVITDDNGKNLFAHRAAYMLTKGDIPEGLVIRHSCDNPACCNPRHLDTGTAADNVMDMMVRQRCAAVKIPIDIAWKMREDFISGFPTNVLAEKYGFERAAIKQLMRKGRVGHMPAVPEEIRRANGVRNQVASRTRPFAVDSII